jgi:hypothetical protein
MSYWILIPKGPIELTNPDTDSPFNPDGSLVGSVPASDVYKALFKDLRITQGVQNQHAGIDVFSAFDLRTTLTQALGGRSVKVTDEEHAILKIIASKPSTLSPVFLNSPKGVAFLRGIADAPNSEPKTPVYEVAEPQTS